MITAIIMASGFSNRMGKNKLFLKIKGDTLIERTIKVIKKSNVDNIIIVYRDEKIKDISEKYNITSIYNKYAEKGQSESIKLGVESSDRNTDGYMFFVGDQPFLNRYIINKIIDKFKGNKKHIIIPLYNYKRGNPIIFPSILRNDLLKIKGDKGGRQIINNNLQITKYIQFEDENLGFDIDTIEDYEKVRDKGE